MNNKVLAAASAALLSAALVVGTPTVAQVQLDDAVSAQLIQLGFTPADWVITQEQALEIMNVVNSTDSDQGKQGRIREIMGDAIVEAGPVGTPAERAAVALEESVSTQLVGLGFTPANWNITQDQALQIMNVVNSNESDESKRDQIRQIMGDDIVEAVPAGTPAERAAQELEESVTAQLIALGFQPSDWVITQEQALELQSVVSSTESDTTKQGQVRQIMGIN